LLNLAHDSFIAIELALLPLPQAPLYLQITFLTDALGAKDTLEQLSSPTVTKGVIPKIEDVKVSFWITREIIKRLAVELSLNATEKEIKAILRVPLPPLPQAAADSEELAKLESDAQILVVDDEQLNREILKDLLELEGWSCDLAENGLEALEKCKKKRYNLIFMDVRMPVLDGIEAIARIREYEKDKDYDTPIVILTAYGLPGDKEKYMQSGANEYLAKPVDAKTLLDTIAHYIHVPTT
jgi:CheY-like chemotaxis protein